MTSTTAQRPAGVQGVDPDVRRDGHPLFDVRGLTALVTGSSRGIGAVLATGLLEAGATVVVHGRSQGSARAAAEQLTPVAERWRSHVHATWFDVTEPAEVRDGVARAEELTGGLGAVVNNAGIQVRAPLLDFSTEAFDEVLRTNLTSAFLVTREAARGMLARGTGKVVNICSVQTELARPGIAPYSAAKGALKMLTRGMAAEWAGNGIAVNGLAPGYIATELTRPLREDPQFDGWVRGRTPAGRWGAPRDLVGALLFLVSPASDFVHGQVLFVDGGMTAVV